MRFANRPILGLLAVSALTLLMAPTVGDVGGCGRTAEDLDLERFANVRRSIECQRCAECGLTTNRCALACDPSLTAPFELGDTCHPVEHDGDVCLRALQSVSCERFAMAVADTGAEVPTECAFCKARGATMDEEGGTFAPPGALVPDAGDLEGGDAP